VNLIRAVVAGITAAKKIGRSMRETDPIVTEAQGQLVWVVMGNDFPDCVCATQEIAERYVAAKRHDQDLINSSSQTGYIARVYWRAHEFQLIQS
jgi:hypothetical protein